MFKIGQTTVGNGTRKKVGRVVQLSRAQDNSVNHNFPDIVMFTKTIVGKYSYPMLTKGGSGGRVD